MPIDIYLFPAIRLYQEICHFWSFDIQFLHFLAENGTISSKFSVHEIQNYLYDGRIGFYETPFWLPHGMY